MITTNTTTTAIAKIKNLAEQSLNAWQMAIDTCIDLNGRELPKKRARAEKDAATAEQAWEDAIDLIEQGLWADAATHLEGARALASEWGDSSYEDEALEFIRSRGIGVDMRVEGGRGADYDTGRVCAIFDGGRWAEVAWDTGVVTEHPVDQLTVIE